MLNASGLNSLTVGNVMTGHSGVAILNLGNIGGNLTVGTSGTRVAQNGVSGDYTINAGVIDGAVTIANGGEINVAGNISINIGEIKGGNSQIARGQNITANSSASIEVGKVSDSTTTLGIGNVTANDNVNVKVGSIASAVTVGNLASDNITLDLSATLGQNTLGSIGGKNIVYKGSSLKAVAAGVTLTAEAGANANSKYDFKASATGSIENDTLTIQANDYLKSITVTGDLGGGVDTFAITGLDNDDNNALESIDFSGLKYETLTPLTIDDANTALKSIKMGDGNDTLTLNENIANDITVYTGAGTDTITATALADGKHLSIVSGEGAKTFTLTAAKAKANSADKYTEIVGIKSGDTITVAGVAAGRIVNANDVAQGANTLADKLIAVAANATSVKVKAFDYEGSAYLVVADTTTGLGDDDVIIKLAGASVGSLENTVTLTANTITFG